MTGDLKVLLLGNANGRFELGVSGELDLSTAEELRSAVEARLDGETVAEVVLDMASVSFIDSSGLNTLIAVQRSVRERGGRLVVRAPSRTVRRLFEITAIDRVITVED